MESIKPGANTMNSWMKRIVIVVGLIVLCPLIAQAYVQWAVQPVPADIAARMGAQQVSELLPLDGQIDPELMRPGMSHEAFMAVSIERTHLKHRMMRVSA